MAIRTDIRCQSCETPLTGGIDTFGDIGQEMCATCWLGLMDDYEPRKVTIGPSGVVFDYEEDEPDDMGLSDEEFFERDGMSFCSACGILACPGEEEFDWCDHITGEDCYHYRESVFADGDDDEYDDDERSER